MLIVKVDYSSIQTEKILLGRTGENERTQVQINCAAVYAEYPSAVASLVVKAPNGDKYPVATTVSNNAVIWDVLDSMLVHTGVGEYQLTFTLGDVVAKSAIGKFVVTQSIEADGSMPSVIEDWMQEANEALGGIPNQVADAVDDYVSTNWSSWSGALDRTLSSSQSAAPADMVGDLKSAKADKDGTHEDLTAGNALYLLSDRGDTDVEPYVFRKTGGAKNGYGREFLRKIVGGTVAWNQLASTDLSAAESNGITFTPSKNGISLTGTATADANYYMNRVDYIVNHIYFLDGNPEGATASGYRLYAFSTNENKNKLIKPISTDWFTLRITVGNGTATGVVFKPQIFDLTKMFGSTIADAIYAMEQATPGSGVAWFRSLFPKGYYAYNAGSLQSVQASGHKLSGKNLYDISSAQIATVGNNGILAPSTNRITSGLIRVIPGTTYALDTNNSDTHVKWIVMYDSRGVYVGDITKNATSLTWTCPDNTVYIRIVMSFKDDRTITSVYDISHTQVEIGSSTAYEPYQKHTYPLDSSLTLRGIPKWDSTNGLYYDGDEYKPDGSVKRKYGIVDLGTLTWTYTANGYFVSTIPDKRDASYGDLLCAKYEYTKNGGYNTPEGHIGDSGASSYLKQIFIKDSNYSNATDFGQSVNGKYLIYELATPTTEQAEGYRELQISANGGTEEFVDAGVTATTPTRDVSVPVGTETFYPVDIWHLIDELTALVLEN